MTYSAEVVVGTFICPDFHLSEILAISPVVSADETEVVSCLFGSSADFCEQCEEPVTQLQFELRQVELDNEEAVDLYRVRRLA